MTYVIAGLGNPGRAYKNTRHNAGFMVADAISTVIGVKIRGFRFKGRTARGNIEGHKVFLIKPRTFMNLSGQSINACLYGLKVGPEKLVVVHDDIDLSIGSIRVKRKGGSGGQRGIKSIIEALGTDEFVRVRIGVGKPPPHIDPADYVLSAFTKEEKDLVKSAIGQGAEAALSVVVEGVDQAMNKFNSKQ